MSLVGLLDVGRSDRVTVDRAGTLRDHAQAPVDVIVENLSTTGCLLILDRVLPLAALVSIGLPGVGVRYARISRADHPRYACAFLAPVSSRDIAAALSADTVVTGAFPQIPAADSEEAPGVQKWPTGVRIAALVGASALLWAGIIAGVMAIV